MSSSVDYEAIKQELLALKPIKADKFKLMMSAAAILTKLITSERIDAKPIVVGGLSVEFYTRQAYTTRDIDVVTSSSISFREDLLKVGFSKEGRMFAFKELDLALDVVDSSLDGEYDRITKVPVTDDSFVYMISIEDIILVRLDAYENEEDAYWGLSLLTSYQDIVDWNYLDTKVLELAIGARKTYNDWKKIIKY